ncbi:MAG: DUF4412 domain-containing protein [Bacteroidetes bacterium]|nr:DUF4412 domain-containing protein [Bacteroidota bacterium]
MKKFILYFACITFQIVANGNVFAQKVISEGKLVYEITFPDMELDSKMAAMLPTESVVYFNEKFSRTESSMGMGMSSAAIVDKKTGHTTTLMDMMGTKSAIVTTDEMLADAKKKSELEKVQVTVTDEVKEIAGYTCKKAILNDGSGTSFEVYFTDKISSYAQMSTEWKDLNGCPLEFSIDQAGMKMRLVAKSVTAEKVSEDLFKIPADYKIMSQEEMMKMFCGESKGE